MIAAKTHPPTRASWRLVPLGVLALALVGCAATKERSAFELDATRTALVAQMDETEQLEDALDEERAAPPEVVVQPAPPPAPTPLPEPVEEEEEPPPDAVTYWEDDTMVEAAAPVEPGSAAEPAWPLGGGAMPAAGGGVERIVGSVDRVARALEQGNMLTVMEARLADKQRLIDNMEVRLSGRLDPLGLQGLSGPSAPSEADAALAKRLGELAAAQQALQKQVAEKASEEELKQGEAAKAAAEAEEKARWDAMAARVEAVERGGRPPGELNPHGQAPAAGDPAAASKASPSAASTALREEMEALKRENAERSTQEERRRQEVEARRVADEEADRQGRLEAQLAALAARQDQMMTAMQTQERDDRRFFRRVFRKDKEPAAAPATVEVQTAAPAAAQGVDPGSLRAAMRDALAAHDQDARRRDRLDGGDEYDEDDEYDDEEYEEEDEDVLEERSVIEARVAELMERLDAIETSRLPGPQDDAELIGLQSELAELRQRDAELAVTKAELVSLREKNGQRDRRLQSLLAPLQASGFDVRVEDDRARVALPSDVLFGSGSATLSTQGDQTVLGVGRVLLTVPGLRIQVEGHTDNVPMRGGKFSSNWDLAFARARTVLQTLEKAGVPASRMSAASFGDTQPIQDNATPAGRSANRRIDIALQLEED